ncbi:hypothetical protein GC163_04050 [bacterium]|nr:hypothetical protein [bacterium]
MFRLILVCICGLACGPLRAADETVTPPSSRYDATNIYHEQSLRGWTLLVHPSLRDEHAELGGETLTLLDHQLYQIERRLPPTAVKQLRTVKIWIEKAEPHHPCMAYHPDAGWLREHDMNPEKARCVELANARNFLDWTRSQPWMVLHELAHAYHHQFLPKGFENAPLKELHREQMAGEAYLSVLHIRGRKERHYAATNPMEYFAEATEAYFGTNDFYPFVRSELAVHDPLLFDLLGDLWQADAADRQRPRVDDASPEKE